MSEKFDFGRYDTARHSDEGVVMHFRDLETNKKLSIWVKLKGADSEAYQRVMDASTNEVFKQIAKTGKVTRSAEDVREERINSICAMVVEWGGGFENECNDENKKKFFGWRGFSWAPDQAENFIKDRANFLPK